MATLQDLKAEIAREINLLKNDEELEKIGHERKALEAELKSSSLCFWFQNCIWNCSKGRRNNAKESS